MTEPTDKHKEMMRALAALKLEVPEVVAADVQRIVLARIEELELPVPMLLHCPLCSERHLDDGDFATRVHHTHACQRCGHVWRPAIVPTVGVQFLPGYKNAI
jgi:hypothetical protein